MEALPPVAYDAVAEANPREYWRILVRRKWVVIAALVLAAAGSIVYTWRSPRKYAAASKVYVRKPEGLLSFSEYTLYSGQINPNTQIALIKARPVVERAAALLQKQHVDVSVDAVAAALNVSSLPNTELIEIGVEWSDPTVAAKISNAMADAFVAYRTTVARNSQSETLHFLQENLDTARAELTRAEDRLQRFQEQTGYSPAADASTAKAPAEAASLQRAREALAEAQANLRTRRIGQRYVQAQLAKQNRALARGAADAVRDNSRLRKTQADLHAKERELREAQAKLTPEGVATFKPGLAEEVAELKRQLDRQLALAVDGGVDLDLQQKLSARLAELDAEEAEAEARVADLSAALARLTRERRRLPELARRYARLALEKEAHEKIYTFLRQKHKETEISRVSQAGNVERVEAAVPQPTPIWPKPRQNLLFALVFGLMLGVAAAFLIEFLDDSLQTPEDVERYLHLPTLGSIPLIKEPNNRLLTQVGPRSGLAEGYRMIRSSVAFSSVDAPLRTIMVTSAGPGEGKSMMAANLAIVHAQKGMRVILVDCDLRRPCQQKLFRLNGGLGFTNLVVGSATIAGVLQDVGIENLRVIPSGPLPPNPAEMLDSARARQVMEELQEYADLVVFDTPPCVALSDPVVLASQVDGVLMVVESGETNRNAAAQAVYHLAVGKANLLGAILNKVDLRREGYHAYYYYHQNDTYGGDGGGGKPSLGDDQRLGQGDGATGLSRDGAAEQEALAEATGPEGRNGKHL
jgi:capsular exopolysaccharide synthesis family protein